MFWYLTTGYSASNTPCTSLVICMRAGSEACKVIPMASISLVEGKKQLLKIQVPCLVGLQQAFHWGTVLRRVLTVKPSLLLAVMSVVLFLYLLLQFYLKYAGKSFTFTHM